MSGLCARRTNAQVHLRANQTKCERSELPKIARLVQRTLYGRVEMLRPIYWTFLLTMVASWHPPSMVRWREAAKSEIWIVTHSLLTDRLQDGSFPQCRLVVISDAMSGERARQETCLRNNWPILQVFIAHISAESKPERATRLSRLWSDSRARSVSEPRNSSKDARDRTLQSSRAEENRAPNYALHKPPVLRPRIGSGGGSGIHRR